MKALGRCHVPSNIPDRQFEAERANQKWTADFTNIWIVEGWVYVSAAVDARGAYGKASPNTQYNVRPGP